MILCAATKIWCNQINKYTHICVYYIYVCVYILIFYIDIYLYIYIHLLYIKEAFSHTSSQILTHKALDLCTTFKQYIIIVCLIFPNRFQTLHDTPPFLSTLHSANTSFQ